MIYGSPVGWPGNGVIYTSPGSVGGEPRWFRSQPFGCTGFPLERPYRDCAHFNRGMDVSRGQAGCGDTVHAMQAGKVIYSGVLNDGAHAVVIYHGNGNATGYGHLGTRLVAKGQMVAKGDGIGKLGSTGVSTGCHVDLTFKTGFPSDGDVNAFYQDVVGKWGDIWPRLEQNVRVRPKNGDGIRLRTGHSLEAGVYAETAADGHIYRASDDRDLGLISTWRKWLGIQTGGKYQVGGQNSNLWEGIRLRTSDGSRDLWIASLVAQRSAS